MLIETAIHYLLVSFFLKLECLLLLACWSFHLFRDNYKQCQGRQILVKYQPILYNAQGLL